MSDFKELFSFDFEYLTDKRFCNMTWFNAVQANYFMSYSENAKNKLISAKNSSINRSVNLNVKNNIWKCNCKTFEVINSIASLTNASIKDLEGVHSFKDSCYLNYFLKQNSFIFTSNNMLTFGESSNLTCFAKTSLSSSSNKAINWLGWYTRNCVKPNSTHLLKSTTTSLLNSSKTTFISSSTTMTLSSFNFDWLSTLYNTNTTRMTSVLKYDVSSAFYWVSSICIAVITVSCLFVSWFYCWRRYSISRHLSTMRTSRRNNLSTSGPASRRENVPCPQRRNMHFFNSRFTNPAFSKYKMLIIELH